MPEPRDLRWLGHHRLLAVLLEYLELLTQVAESGLANARLGWLQPSLYVLAISSCMSATSKYI